MMPIDTQLAALLDRLNAALTLLHVKARRNLSTMARSTGQRTRRRP